MCLSISNTGLALIKKFEGCRLTAYQDSVGVWTIGYGHTANVKSGQTITQAQADAYLKSDCAAAEKAVNRYNNTYYWNQNQFDALVSFTFNCGTGNLNLLLNNGKRTLAEISAKIPAYNKAGGQVLQGLVNRRAAEKELFDKAASISSASSTLPAASTLSATSTSSAVSTSSAASAASAASASSTVSGAYTHTDFIREVQSAIGAKIDGIAGSETLSKTITVSKTKNNKHAVVKPIQKYLNSIGYNCGTEDGIAGTKFEAAVKAFQKANGCVSDGEITAKATTWKKLLKLA